MDVSTQETVSDTLSDVRSNQASCTVANPTSKAETTAGGEGIRAPPRPDVMASDTESELSANDTDHNSPESTTQKSVATAATAPPAVVTLSDTKASSHQPSELEGTRPDLLPPPQPPPPPIPSSNPLVTNLSTKISTVQSQLSILRAQLTRAHVELIAKTQSQSDHSPPPITDRRPDHGPFPDQDLDPATAAEAEAAAAAIVKRHIRLLRDYNEIKDVGLGLMGLIADGRGCRLGSVMEEFGVGGKD